MSSEQILQPAEDNHTLTLISKHIRYSYSCIPAGIIPEIPSIGIIELFIHGGMGDWSGWFRDGCW